MGQFSWMDCCAPSVQILDNVTADVYLLIPKEFGGGHIHERYYDGYGRFGSVDVYDKVAEWNKDFIPEILRLSECGNWNVCISNVEKSAMINFYNDKPINCELREIGIYMACYDEDNERLPFPIKITHDPLAVYEDCIPSKSDPNQGWPVGNDDDDYDYEIEHLLWNELKKHVGHRVEIAIYGDPNNPIDICLEDIDTNEVILDAGIYTLRARED